MSRLRPKMEWCSCSVPPQQQHKSRILIFLTGLREPKVTLIHVWTTFITSLPQSFSVSSLLISFECEAGMVFITVTDNSHVGNERLELIKIFPLVSFENSSFRTIFVFNIYWVFFFWAGGKPWNLVIIRFHLGVAFQITLVDEFLEYVTKTF